MSAAASLSVGVVARPTHVGSDSRKEAGAAGEADRKVAKGETDDHRVVDAIRANGFSPATLSRKNISA
jgi:hypothetical protein